MAEPLLIAGMVLLCCVGLCVFEGNCCDNCGTGIVNDTTDKEATESPMQTIEI